MGRLCERPGCSEPGAASYGMEPEDLLFWVDTFHPGDGHDTAVLCRRHADAMVVPRGWTLDDRREPQPRLFRTPHDASGAVARPKRRSRSVSASVVRQHVEQLELAASETDESDRATTAPPVDAAADHAAADDAAVDDAAVDDAAGDDAADRATPWMPDFDIDDDLDGLLQVRSPLLARAFRGTDRAR